MAEKKVFAAIEAIEAQIEAAQIGRQKRQEEHLVEHLRAREPLLQRRYELVTGRSEPTDDELQGFVPQGAAAVATTAPAGRGVPFFWLNALCNHEELSGLITPRDRCALEYLEDVRYVRGPAGMAVEFHFAAANPYFYNKVLRKGIYVKRGGGGGGGGPLGDIQGMREEASGIDWKPGRSLFVRPVGKQHQQQQHGTAGKGKKAGGKKPAGGGQGAATRSRRHRGKHSGGPAPDLPEPEEEGEGQQKEEQEEEFGHGNEEEEEAGQGGRRRRCASFFRFFLPMHFPGGGDMGKRRELDPTRDEADEDGEEDDEDEEEEDAAGSEEGEEEDRADGGRVRAPLSSFASASAVRRAADSRVLDVLIKSVVPRAVHLYLGGEAVGGKQPQVRRPQRTSSASGVGGGGGGGEDGEEGEEEGFTLVSGSPAGDVSSLALGAQRALHALRSLQRRMDELCSELKAGEWAAQVEALKAVEGLGAQRRTLLWGPASAPPRQLSIPAFWLRALRAAPVASSAVQRRDEAALAALADVRLVWDVSLMPSAEKQTRKAELQLDFLPNPYFTNATLVRRFTFHAPGGSLNKMGVEAAESDPIDWQPGRNLNLRNPAALAAGEGEADGGSGGKVRRVPTFFALFDDTPGALCRAFGIPGSSRAAQEEAVQAQEEFLAEVMNGLVLFAGRMAVTTKLDLSDLGDECEDGEEEEDDEDEEEEDDGEEESGGAAAAARAERRAAARAAAAAARSGGRRRGSESGGGLLPGSMLGRGGVVMGVFLAVMLLAQVLVFLDTLEFVRGRFKWAA